MNKAQIHIAHMSLKKIFSKSVEAVLPHKLDYAIRSSKGHVWVNLPEGQFEITSKRCFLVGFGKAALGMAVQVERLLGNSVVNGVLSIPDSSQYDDRQAELNLSKNSRISVNVGGRNNLPDEASMETATKIKKLATQMTQNDVLFVLISGGGSALLPLPDCRISLSEKVRIIKRLSNSGASIEELNLVRIALSSIKGGLLAHAARDAFAVISYIISDIVGDPIDLIACGPTVIPKSHSYGAEHVLKKYCLWDALSFQIKDVVRTPIVKCSPGLNNFNFIVGNNMIATVAAATEGYKCGYEAFTASTKISGDLPNIVKTYVKFSSDVLKFLRKTINEEEFLTRYPFETETRDGFFKAMRRAQNNNRDLLLILAGEPTVKVIGSGIGGRNQELALRMSISLYQDPKLHDIIFLSAGTDGVDGPSLAAGALGGSCVVKDYLRLHKKEDLTSLMNFVQNNDSYNFYCTLKEGQYHIITGQTGTNVMDLHLLLVPVSM